jgi:hypothetical protein
LGEGNRSFELGESKMSDRKFQTKAFISLLTLGSFVIMTITGLVLYAAPQGRIAYWVTWKFWGLEKSQWEAIHIVSCFFFVVVGIYHLLNNWSLLENYLTGKIAGALKMKRELGYSALLILVILIGPMFRVAPFTYLLDLGDALKKSWIISKEYEPPFGHAEEVSLRVFAKKVNLDLGKAMDELKAKGIQADAGDSLQKIATTNGISPMQLYRAIKRFEAPAPDATGARGLAFTPDLVDEKFAGTGVGRKTLGDMIRQTGLDPAKAKERLAKNKVEMKDEETFHDAAERRKITPMDLLKVVLVENYELKE